MQAGTLHICSLLYARSVASNIGALILQPPARGPLLLILVIAPTRRETQFSRCHFRPGQTPPDPISVGCAPPCPPPCPRPSGIRVVVVTAVATPTVPSWSMWNTRARTRQALRQQTDTHTTQAAHHTHMRFTHSSTHAACTHATTQAKPPRHALGS